MKRLKTGGWCRHGFVRSLDLGLLMGVPYYFLGERNPPEICYREKQTASALPADDHETNCRRRPSPQRSKDERPAISQQHENMAAKLFGRKALEVPRRSA